MTYVIEKNIPMPAARHREAKYPFAEMSVGDSFVVSAGLPKKDYVNARSACVVWGKRLNMKFSARKFQGGLRVWRTA